MLETKICDKYANKYCRIAQQYHHDHTRNIFFILFLTHHRHLQVNVHVHTFLTIVVILNFNGGST